MRGRSISDIPPDPEPSPSPRRRRGSIEFIPPAPPAPPIPPMAMSMRRSEFELEEPPARTLIAASCTFKSALQASVGTAKQAAAAVSKAATSVLHSATLVKSVIVAHFGAKLAVGITYSESPRRRRGKSPPIPPMSPPAPPMPPMSIRGRSISEDDPDPPSPLSPRRRRGSIEFIPLASPPPIPPISIRGRSISEDDPDPPSPLSPEEEGKHHVVHSSAAH